MKLSGTAIQRIEDHLNSDEPTDIIIRMIKGRVRIDMGGTSFTVHEERERTRQQITGVDDDAFDSEDKLQRLREIGAI